MLKKVIYVLLVAIVLVGVVYFGYSYLNNADAIIFRESASHLEEIYSLMGDSISSLNDSYLDSMHLFQTQMEYLMEDDVDYAFVSSMVSSWKESLGFDEFYFVSRNGEMMTTEGKYKRYDLSSSLVKLMVDGEDIVTDVSLPGSDGITLYAIKSRKNKYRSFTFEAIAIIFRNDAVLDLLSVNAFQGRSENYVVNSEGKIMFGSSDQRADNARFYNIISFLKDKSNLSQSSLKILEDSWKEKRGETMSIKIDGVPYYMVSEPLGVSDWVLVGMVEASIVNNNIDTLQRITVGLGLSVSALLIVVLISLIWVSFLWARKRQTDEILFRDSLFSELSQNVDDVFIVLDGEMKNVVLVTPNSMSVLGVDSKDIRKNINNIDNNINSISISNKLYSIKEEERSSWNQEYFNKYDSEKKYLEITAYRTHFNSLKRIVVAISDRTKERQLQETLSASLEIAKNANAAKSNFLANMSHDIRTPMNAIVGYSTLLMKEADNGDKVREIGKKITFSSRHLLSLINDVLDMSKIESGNTSLNVDKVELSSLISSISEIVLVQTRSKKQKFEIKTNGTLPDYIYADNLRLSQILLNLLSNAVKYTQREGEIVLLVEGYGTKGQTTHIRFVVSDNGQGMSPEFLKTVFDPFSREINSTTNKIQGTGLGMSITKSIIDLMGGTIKVESQVGKGSVFTVELAFSVPLSEDLTSFFSDHGINRILVADDDSDVLDNVTSSLEGAGLSVEKADCGEEAISKSREAYENNKPFDSIIIDWKMPGIDGIESVRRIRKEVGDDIPIFVLTAYDFSLIEDEAKEAGVNVLLPKPFFLTNFQRVLGEFFHDKTKDDHKAEKSDDFTGVRILVVEDNEINAEIITELLKSIGVEANIAEDGMAALEVFCSSCVDEFDMIFMDIQMPKMDGYESARRIRSSNHPRAVSIPIIAMTANAFEDDVKASMEAGMNAHISKPIDFDRLKAVIASFRR